MSAAQAFPEHFCSVCDWAWPHRRAKLHADEVVAIMSELGDSTAGPGTATFARLVAERASETFSVAPADALCRYAVFAEARIRSDPSADSAQEVRGLAALRTRMAALSGLARVVRETAAARMSVLPLS
jgi:hypothetical protein